MPKYANENGERAMNYNLTSHIMTDEEKQIVCSWKYEGEYELYNLPSYQEMKEKRWGFMNPKSEKNYYSFYDGELLVGFVNILEEETEVFIGIGANPTICGKGYGQQMLKDAYHLSKKLYPDKSLYLEVRDWNKRAIRCYQKAGFKVDGEPYELTTGVGTGSFYRMVRK